MHINIRRAIINIGVVCIALIVAITSFAISSETYAASKKAKYTYSVKVTNINSNTVIKKGTKLKVAYKATKKKKGKVSGTKVKFKSSNKKVASISKKGVIKAKKKGTTYITVYCKSKPSKKKRIKIRVGTPVSSVKVSGFTYLGKGHSAYLKAKTNSKATNKKVSWKSDNTSVATVNSSGKVTAKGYGAATIYATAKDGSRVQGHRTVYVHKYMRSETVWIAHRGLHTSARENTAAAFAAAGDARFQAAECDIWETAKEEPDATLPEFPSENAVGDTGDDEGGDNSENTEGGESEIPDIPDVTDLKTAIESLPGTAASYDVMIDTKADIYAVWKQYESFVTDNDLSNEQQSLVREALVDNNTSRDLLKELFDMYTMVYGYDSMDIVINHDATFSNGKTVKAMTVSQIDKSISYACYLGEYLDICKQYNMIPVVEFKDSKMSTEAVRKAVDIIYKDEKCDNAILISFHENILQEAKERAEDMGISPITYHLFSSNGSKEVKIARDRGFTGISVRKDVLTDSIYNEAKSYGLGVGTWTYKNDADSDEYLGQHLLSGKYKLDFATVDYKVYKD